MYTKISGLDTVARYLKLPSKFESDYITETSFCKETIDYVNEGNKRMEENMAASPNC